MGLTNKKYVSFDAPFIEKQARENPNTFLMLNQPPVIYYEIQRVTNIFRYIKIKYDEENERDLFCLSGSQPFELMRNVSETLLDSV